MLGWRKLLVRSQVERPIFLDPAEFESLLARERSRADRANSCFSLVTLNLPTTELQSAEIRAFSEIIRQRRRATDLIGRTQDGRIEMALPDTNRAHAEVLAAFLRDALRDRGISCTHAISVYPDTET